MKKDVFVIKKNYAYLITVVIILAVSLPVFFFMSAKPSGNITALSYANTNDGMMADSVDEEPVSAEEIYKLFICSCCGRTIDAKCCGMARDMVNYVDSQVDAGLSKTDVIIQTVKKYGIDTLVESMQNDIKDELIKRAPADRPKIVVDPDIYDFGDVSQAEGTARAFFTVRNDGDSALVIDGLQTSCGCTTASLEGSSFFGMPGHGGQGASPPGWSHEVPAGSTARLEVRYDPNMHKDFRGGASRVVYISSNDPIDFRKEVRIELNQVD
jgi:hypothetical protein